ncbi:hypothetical protein HAX54_037280, partial [Datura stramonium]|nr:hypothetical protein [Datura stramonium]
MSPSRSQLSTLTSPSSCGSCSILSNLCIKDSSSTPDKSPHGALAPAPALAHVISTGYN